MEEPSASSRNYKINRPDLGLMRKEKDVIEEELEQRQLKRWSGLEDVQRAVN